VIAAFALLAALQANPDRPPPDYRPLRYEEDWSVLRLGDRRPDFFDPIKYIPLNAAGDVWLTLGGNLREQMETYVNQDFGTGPARDSYLLHRMYPFADFHAGDPFRLFVMVKDAMAFDTQNHPFPSQQNTIDLHQAFCDVAFESGAGKVTIRPGRQELLYGAGRLFDDRSGPNSKFTYDLVRAIFEPGTLRFDAFYGRPVQSDFFGFDDYSRNSARVWGVYGRVPLGDLSGLEPYVLGIERKGHAFNEGTGDALRTVVGARFYSPRGDGFDWNVEPIVEAGTFGSGNLAAWGIYTDTGWTVASLPGAPRIGTRADVLSGDRRQGDGDLGTFDSFFPRGILHGEAGSFGPSNLIALTPEFTIQPLEPLYLSARWTFYWRESRQDGLYTLNLGLYAPSGTSDEQFVGHEISVTADYYLGRHAILSSVVSFTKTGPFLRDSGYTKDQTFVSATLTFKW
jgi:hypothetical protein